MVVDGLYLVNAAGTIFDGALDLLKQYSGMVWDPGRFAVLLRGGDVRSLRLGNPAGAPSPRRLTPGNAWATQRDCWQVL